MSLVDVLRIYTMELEELLRNNLSLFYLHVSKTSFKDNNIIIQNQHCLQKPGRGCPLPLRGLQDLPESSGS
jgi:hypothetical protein